MLGLSKAQTAQEPFGFYPESYARDHAITTAMPIYPQHAIQQGITGVVQARILINERGEVTQIKTRPSIDTSLKQAIADAVCKWTFKLDPGVLVPVNFLSRLTFRFSINDGRPRVELYNPGPSAKDSEHLGQTHSMKELRDWNQWEEVKPKECQLQ